MTPFLDTLHLHIGLEKTGTSSIQAFLDINRAALARQNLLLPGSLGHHNHKMLAAYAFEAGSRDIAVTSSEVGPTERDVDAFRARLAAALTREIEESGLGQAVITSEDLSRLFQPEQIERVLALLRPLARRIHVIVFVRRQDLLATSRYYSLLLGGSTRFNVLPGPEDGGQKFYDYEVNIGRWIDAVGERNVTLVRFPENTRAEPFNSVDRFCDLLGIDPTGMVAPPRTHVSPDAVTQVALQNFNVVRGRYDPEGIDALLRSLAPQNDRRYGHIPGRDQAQRFNARYEASNRALCARLGVPGEMFTDDVSMYPETNMRAHYQQLAIQRLLRLLQPEASDPGAAG